MSVRQITVHALIERYRDLMNSTNLCERFRTLWVAAMLEERLALCTDRDIGVLMVVVRDKFGIFESELALCYHAMGRLLRSYGVGTRNEYLDRVQGGA